MHFELLVLVLATASSLMAQPTQYRITQSYPLGGK